MAHLLVVEDDSSVANLLRMVLTRASHTVTLAADGIEAIDYALRHRPDLIMMDIGLPIRNGWTAIALLKSDHRTRDIPIVILTAHVGREYEMMARATGCAAFVAKPFEIEQLLATIDSLIGRGRCLGGDEQLTLDNRLPV